MVFIPALIRVWTDLNIILRYLQWSSQNEKLLRPLSNSTSLRKIRKHHPYVDHLRALHRWWKPILVKTVVGRIGLRLVSLWGARWWVLCTKDRALCTSTMNNHRPPLLLLHLVLTSVPQMNWHQSDFWCLCAFSGAHFGANSGAMACGHHFQRCNHQYCIHGVKRHLCDMHCGKRCRVRLKSRINLFHGSVCKIDVMSTSTSSSTSLSLCLGGAVVLISHYPWHLPQLFSCSFAIKNGFVVETAPFFDGSDE